MKTLGRSASYVWRMNKNRARYWGKRGKILAFSIVNGHIPYVVGVIELENGEKIAGQIVGAPVNKIRHGMEVVGVVRKVWREQDSELVVYGVKFAVCGY